MKTLIKPSLSQRCLGVFEYCALWLPCFFVLLIGVIICNNAWATDDYLSGAMPAVTHTFGENSSFIKIIYIAEVGAIAFAWIKTKSPMVLLGLPVLLLATHFFFSSIGTGS